MHTCRDNQSALQDEEQWLSGAAATHACGKEQLAVPTMQWAPYLERGTGDSLDALVQQRT